MTKEEQEEYLRQVGYRLGHLRLEKNVSGQEIADRIGKSKSVVSKIENGGYRITMDVLLAYSDVLQIPLSDLITIEDLTPALARYMPDLSPRFQQLAVSLLNCLWEEYTGRSSMRAIRTEGVEARLKKLQRANQIMKITRMDGLW